MNPHEPDATRHESSSELPADQGNPTEAPLPDGDPLVQPTGGGKDEQPAVPPRIAWTLIVALGLGIWLAAAWHEGTWLPAQRWRLLAIFFAVVLALMLRPMAGGAVVLLGVVLTVMVGALDMKTALAGYADSTVWLVLAAYFISRAFINTGLARRIALGFVRLLGGTTLGLSYALLATDTLLAGMIPSNAARVGGVLLPITRSLAELYKSYPGKSAGLLGSFLMLTLYQGDVVACALFLTGQASNPLAAKQAAEATLKVPGGPVVLSYTTWTLWALAPALVSLAIVPWLIYRWQKPEITRTPAAAEFAANELRAMGPLKRDDWVLLCTFVGVCGLWIAKGVFNVLPDMKSSDWTAVVALSGAGVLFLSGVVTWNDAISEKGAWDVFIWYGGLVQLGLQLQETGLTEQFAKLVVGHLGGLELVPLFLVTLLIYFYAHYAFASITVHLVSMYPAFVGVLIAAGAPPALVVACFAYFANFSAGLTHYGTTPAPIVFSLNYVSQGTWWKVGLVMSVVNIVVWLTVGMGWWKLLGLW